LKEAAPERYKSGLSRYSTIAILYAMLIFIPSSIYLNLMTGTDAAISSWFTLLLFVELGRRAGMRISKQEAAIIFMFAGGIQFGAMDFIYRSWYAQSDIVKSFGFEKQIPWWYAPSADSGAYASQNIFQPAFFAPISIVIILTILSIFVGWGWSILSREIYIESEDLPFPITTMNAQVILLLTGERQSPLKILSISALGGLVYGFLTYVFPFVMVAITGLPYSQVTLIPLPWVDWHKYIETYFPGAMFGIATDLTLYTLGFIVPFSYLLQIFLASFAIYFIGNWLTVIQNPPYGPHDWWAPGMSAQIAAQRSILYNWASFTIGLTLAAGIIPLLIRPNTLRKAFTFLRRSASGRRTEPIIGGYMVGLVLPIFVGIVARGAIFIYFVPNYVMQFPWVLFIFPVLTLLTTLLIGRGQGETGIAVSLGPVTNMIYYLTEAPVSVWFTPNPGFTGGWGGWSGSAFGSWSGASSSMKLADMLETKLSSLLKTMCIFVPLAIFVSIFFTQSFWTIAPIPSGRYPGVAIFWPINATYTSVWIQGKEKGLFSLLNVLMAFGVGAVISAVGIFTHLPVSIIALAIGANTFPQHGLAYLIGGIVALVLKRILGNKFWEEYRQIIAGGIILGISLSVTLAVAIALISGSLLPLPW
jgi:hypothetical protein